VHNNVIFSQDPPAVAYLPQSLRASKGSVAIPKKEANKREKWSKFGHHETTSCNYLILWHNLNCFYIKLKFGEKK